MRAVASIIPSKPAPPACPWLAQSGEQAEAPPAELPPSSRALVLASSAPGTAVDPAGSRPSAMFLAQLIATAQQAPQTRRRRRGAPSEASALYAAASTAAPWMGRAVYRSL